MRIVLLTMAMILSPPLSAFAPIMPVTSTASSRSRQLQLHMTSNNPSEASQKQLGIEIGKQMDFLQSEEDKAELKAELTKIVDEAVANGISDLENLHAKWQRDLENGKALSKLEVKMNQNGRLAKYRFNRKVDNLVESFFNQTLASRQRTHELATEDVARQQREELEQKRKKRRAEQPPKTESWAKTNDAWDKEWDDW